MRGLLDREDLAIRDSGGVGFRRFGGGTGGICWLIWGFVKALNKARLWPAAKVGMARASRSGDCHGLSPFLGGGARGRWLHGVHLGSKVSMMIMGPPQQGQGWARAGGSVSSAVWVSSASGIGMRSSSRARAMLRVPRMRLYVVSPQSSGNPKTDDPRAVAPH